MSKPTVTEGVSAAIVDAASADGRFVVEPT
jgi:hypothetical protein